MNPNYGPIPVLTVPFDTPEYQHGLYDRYAEMRRVGPIFRTPDGYVYLTRFEDCRRLLEDPSFVRRPPTSSRPLSTQQGTPNTTERMLNDWLVFQDPPRHEHTLQQIATSFSPQRVRALEPRIRRIAESLLDHLPVDSDVDFVSHFAYRLPIAVIGELLEIPQGMEQELRDWSDAITRALDTGTTEHTSRAETAVIALQRYFSGHVDDVARGNKDTPLSDLLRAMKHTTLQREEVINFCIFLLWAGHETTKHLLANGLLLLLRNPTQTVVLRDDLRRLPGAIEEMLRFDSPIQKLSRWTVTDRQYGTSTVPRGTLLTALVGSANHDPEVFVDPESFRIDRNTSHHIGFGAGLHRCLGAGLARLEARIAFELLLTRYRSMQLIDHRWMPFSSFRGLEHLEVRFH